jgi:hypothetical protein
MPVKSYRSSRCVTKTSSEGEEVGNGGARHSSLVGQTLLGYCDTTASQTCLVVTVLCRALFEVCDALKILCTRMLLSAQGPVLDAPLTLTTSAVRVAATWSPLALALRLPRNDAFRLATCATTFAMLVSAAAFESEALEGTAVHHPSCPPWLTACLLLQLLDATLSFCRPKQAGLEVAAAAGPPDRVLPVLFAAGRVLLDALESGAATEHLISLRLDCLAMAHHLLV